MSIYDNTTIFIPLGTGSKWDDNELKIMLRSIDHHISDANIVIYCTEIPHWLNNCTVRKVGRYYPEWLYDKYNGEKHYENYFDTLNKMSMFVNSGDAPFRFIYAYDDNVLLRKPTEDELFGSTALCLEPDINERIGSKHGKTIISSYNLLDKPKTFYNYETHIPRSYIKDKIKMMFELYDFKKMDVPYPIGTMYYNLFFGKPDRVIKDSNDIKAGFYGWNDTSIGDDNCSENMDMIKAVCKDKLWLSYNDMGLNAPAADGSGNHYLKDYLLSLYPNKCKYEK